MESRSTNTWIREQEPRLCVSGNWWMPLEKLSCWGVRKMLWRGKRLGRFVRRKSWREVVYDLRWGVRVLKQCKVSIRSTDNSLLEGLNSECRGTYLLPVEIGLLVIPVPVMFYICIVILFIILLFCHEDRSIKFVQNFRALPLWEL
jgi:hypothetical protein